MKKTLKTCGTLSLLTLLNTLAVYADEAAEQTAGPYDWLSALMPFVLMIAVFYFILIRPQRKKDKALKALIADAKTGDEIVTIGGIHGKIVRIKDDTVVIESGAGVDKSKLRIDRSAISRIEKKYEGKKDFTPIPGFEDEEEETEAEE